MLYTPDPTCPTRLGCRARSRFRDRDLVVIDFCITEVGKTTEVRVASGRKRLAELSKAKVSAWRAKPAVRDGKTMSTCHTAIFLFSADRKLFKCPPVYESVKLEDGLEMCVAHRVRSR